MNPFFLLEADGNSTQRNRKYSGDLPDRKEPEYLEEFQQRKFKLNIPSSPGTRNENIRPRPEPENDDESILDKNSVDRLLNLNTGTNRRFSPAKMQRLVHRLASMRPLAQDGIIAVKDGSLSVALPGYPSITHSVQGINRTLKSIGTSSAARLLQALFADNNDWEGYV